MINTQTKSSFRLTVSDFNQLFKQMVESDGVFSDLWIEGEICQLKAPSSYAQRYLTLTDGTSFLSCVFYDSLARKDQFSLQNGQKVLAKGKLKFFQKRAQLVFQLHYIQLAGQGDLQAHLQALKAKLRDEGLFDPDRKLPLPTYPEHIALITADHSAALSDFLSIAQTHFPHVQLTLVPALMQGDDAPRSILQALEKTSEISPDLTILFRGGGSAQDLSVFHSEILVRAISDYSYPLISAIGHELDYHLVDFVADYRAQTPSAAAHHIGAPFTSVKDFISQRVYPLARHLSDRCVSLEEQLPLKLSQAFHHLNHIQETHSQRFSALSHRLDLANPLRKFNDGFSLCRLAKTDQVVSSVSTVSTHDPLHIRLSDGTIEATVTEIHHEQKS